MGCERRAAEKLAELFSWCQFSAKLVCSGVEMTQKGSLRYAEERLVTKSRFKHTFSPPFHPAIFLMISSISGRPQHLLSQKERLFILLPYFSSHTPVNEPQTNSDPTKLHGSPETARLARHLQSPARSPTCSAVFNLFHSGPENKTRCDRAS